MYRTPTLHTKRPTLKGEGNMPGEKDGDRWVDSDGTTHTVNSTSDPAVPGGFYHTQVSPSGDKATAVYNSDYSFADVPANKSWD